MADFFQTLIETPGLMIVAVTVLSLIVLIPATILSSRSKRRLDDRLAYEADVAVERFGEPSAGLRLIEGIGRRLGEPNAEEVSKLQARLMRAGFFSKTAPYYFLVLRLAMLVLPQGALFLTWPLIEPYLESFGLLTVSVFVAAIGYVLPSILLDRKIDQREQLYRDGFPDMMDLLVACIQAGLSLDAAVLRISHELKPRYPALAEQLRLMTLEMRAGRDRTEAWRNFANRLGLDEARSLVTMLKQSEELGTSVGDTLRVFADDMRERRMLLAEEKALALPAKLVLPLIAFVFPSLLVVLMLPAVVRMMWVMNGTAA